MHKAESPEEWREKLLACVLAARILTDVGVEHMLDMINWIQMHGQLAEEKELLQAALPLARIGEKLKRLETEQAQRTRQVPQ